MEASRLPATQPAGRIVVVAACAGAAAAAIAIVYLAVVFVLVARDFTASTP